MNPQISKNLALVLLVFYGIICNLQAQEYDLNTSLDMHWPTPTSPKPEYLGHVFDPAFGTKIVRITGDPGTPVPNLNENWRNTARHSYSIKQTWNADETIMYINRHRDLGGDWGSALFLDGQTYEVLSTSNIIPSGGNASRWHTTDPSIRIILTNNSFNSWNFHTGEVNQLMTWTGYSNTQWGPYTGNLSDDGSMAAVLATRNSDNKLVGFAVDMVNDIKYPDIDFSSIPNIDYISISPLGNYILVNANFGTGSDRTKIFDLEGNQVGPFWSQYGQPSHFDMTVDDNGDEIAVGVDKSNNVTGGRIIKRRLSDGLVTQITTHGYVSHTTARALGRPGWVYASTGSSQSSDKWLPYLNEVIAVKLDGSRVERICHSRNLYSNYENQAHPSPSPSGSRIVFASDWRSGNVPIQCYVADFRGLEIIANQVTITSNATNNTLCQNETTTLTASGSDSYLWESGETSPDLDVSPDITTTYTVTGTQSDGSTTVANITITVNELPTANAGSDTETCIGTPVTLTASGGETYLWSNGAQTATMTINPINTTTYTVQVFQNNCSSTDEVTVTVNEVPEVDAGEDQTIFDTESATLTATGTDSYLWSTGETTQSITVNPQLDTSYWVTGTTNGCEHTDTVTVFSLDDSVNASAGADTGICIGESTILTATGGTTYLWSTGETTASIEVSPTEITTYTVIAYSLSGTNFEDDSVIVSVNELPVANAGDDVSICFGNSTALTASGGTTYLWSTGESTQTIAVNPNNTTTYTVEVFENNCSSIDQLVVIISDLPETNAGSNISITEGESTTLTATGADSYVWSTGETTSSINVEPSVTTTYTVVGTNSNGCEFSDSVIVSLGEESVTANAGANVTICNGESTTLIATGGASYLWSTGETTVSINVNPNESTSYTVTAFNTAATVSDDDSVTVTVNDLPETNAGNDISIFEGDSTILTASGADSYVWNTGETTSSITVNPETTTTYSVIGNSNGCEFSDNVIVSVETETINANAGANVAICNGENTALTATGGASYLWSTGQTTATIEVSPIATTAYTVTVFSSNGTDSDDDSVTVTVNEVPVADAGNDVAICFGNETTISASGGATYLWNTGETTQNITVNPNSTTTYTVEVFTSNCSSTDDIIITVNDLPETNAGNNITITEGSSTTLTATGAASYVWSTGETTSSISINPMTTTTYTVTGLSNGCESIDDVIITVVPYTASAGANQTICQGYETTLTASEGGSYLWNTGETTQSITVNPTNTQTFTVTVFEGDFQADAEVEVSVSPNPNVVITNGNDVMILEGEFITLSASGANSYSWNNGATQPNIAVSPSITKTYEVTGFINNCEDTTAVIVNVLEIVEANAGEDLITCSEEIVTLTATGGEDYLWSNGETTQSIEVSPNVDTEYSVLVYNALDSDEDTVMIFVEECSTIELPIESETFDFVIYQDPTTDILNVRIDGLQSVTARGFSIYDISGKVVYTETFRPSEMEDLFQMTRELDVSTYSKGVYIVRLNYDDTSLLKKIPIR
jgi:hypothetical protein